MFFKKSNVSIIIPTHNRYDVVIESIAEIKKQKYKNYEIIICDDSDKDYYIKNFSCYEKKLNSYKVKHIYGARYDVNGKKDYGLARSRNLGIIESIGEFLIFIDDRFTFADEFVIEKFVKELSKDKEKVWIFGNKGCYNIIDENGNLKQIEQPKTTFVENFSAIRREHIINAGMFCERIDQYGGMTEEITLRLNKQGFRFFFHSDIRAKQICKSSGWDKKPEQIKAMSKVIYKMHKYKAT